MFYGLNGLPHLQIQAIPTRKKNPSISTLPFEIIKNIFSHLEKNSLHSASAVNSLWNGVITRYIIKKEFSKTEGRELNKLKQLGEFNLLKLKRFLEDQGEYPLLEQIIDLALACKSLDLRTGRNAKPVQNFFKNMHLKNGNHNTILHAAAQNLEMLKMLIKCLFPRQDRFIAMQARDAKNKMVLDLAVTDPQSLKFVLEFLDKNDRMAAILLIKENGQNASITWKEELKLLVECYWVMRLNEVDNYIGFSFTGYSKFQKEAAVKGLLGLLNGCNNYCIVENLIPIISDGRLGKIIKKFLDKNKPEGIVTATNLVRFLTKKR